MRQVKYFSTSRTLLNCAIEVFPDVAGIASCAQAIQSGNLVAFPTETVYGLGAHALNETALAKIFRAKARPHSDPLIVHVLSSEDFDNFFDFSNDDEMGSSNRDACKSLSDSFWPGPLTIVYRSKATVPDLVTAGTGYVGLRSPVHSIARALLIATGLPIAAPSANRFGHVSPTSAAHVMSDLGNSTENILVLKDNISYSGGCSVGIESTVCQVSSNNINILRSGAISMTEIRNALKEKGLLNYNVILNNKKDMKSNKEFKSNINKNIPLNNDDNDDSEFQAVAPGQMTKHYAPDIPTFIISNNNDISNNQITNKIDLNSSFIIDFGGKLSYFKNLCIHYIDLSESSNAKEACYKLFHVLRISESNEMISKGVKTVLLPDLYCDEIVDGMNDDLKVALWERLYRAASGIRISKSILY